MTLYVLLCSFVSGIAGGFIGYIVSDWQYAKWSKRRHERAVRKYYSDPAHNRRRLRGL